MGERGIFMKKAVVIIICVLVVVIGLIAWGFYNADNEVINVNPEIIPQEEISEDQMRSTLVLLYFVSKETGEIVPESKLIDVKDLMENPYKKLIELWLCGSSNEKYTNFCGKNVELIGVKNENGVVKIDFSKAFVDEFSGGSEDVLKSINSLVNTLTELTEVEFVQILINGEENVSLNGINLGEKYCRVN